MNIKKASDSVRKTVIYQINLRVFSPEGTIAGAEKYLPDIQKTGADMVYLCPFVESDPDERFDFWSSRQRWSNCGNPRNPYRLSDYYKIDPEYGTDADMLSFVKKAHALGLKVMFDLVYMHAGPTFGEKYPQYVQHDEQGKAVLNNYNFCTIDFDSMELREYLWRNMLYFVEKFGIDGYRTDVGGCVPLDFWIEGVRRIKKLRPDFIMLNEAEFERRPEDQLEAFDINYSQYWQMVTMPQIFAYGEPVRVLELAWNSVHKVSEHAMVLRGIEHHDTANDMFYRRVECVSSDKCDAAYVLCYCIDGVPFLYNGCEYKDKSRHSIFGKKGQFTIDRSQDPAPRFALLQKLAQIHRNEKSVLYGSTRWLKQDQEDSVAVIERHFEGETIVCAVNLGNESCRVNCPEFPSDGTVLLQRGYTPGFSLEANGYVVIRTAVK